jgi:2-keto-3-deoxy-L-fuconate dehydrogenase
MASRVKGKTALVTSAGQGIGRASAVALAREGAKVFATDLKAELLTGLDGIECFALDVTKPSAIDEAVKRTGAIDVLFNCSGFVHHGTIMDATDKEWDFAFDLNCKAHYHMMKAYLPGMLEKGKGSIINMASVASSIKGAPNRFIYGASKAAVIGMTKAMATDYVTKGIRCNAICPGTVETPSLYDRMRAQGDFETAKAAFIARQPMGRLAQPQEIAELVVYLASEETEFMTGQAISIDGGWSL